MLPSKNQQDVVEISCGDEEENVVTNFENKCLQDSEIEAIRNSKMLTEVVITRCQQILKSQYKMLRYGLVDSALGQKLMFRNEKGEFVQISHNGSYHWVSVSTVPIIVISTVRKIN